MPSLCPHCNHPQPRPGQKFCSHCGHVLSPPQAVASPLGWSQRGRTLRVGPSNDAKLLIEEGGQVGEVVLGDVPLTLGRGPQHPIILHSPFVSAAHAQIVPFGNGHQIVDLNSTNGILYQGQRIPAQTAISLADCDILRIGDPIGGNFVTLTYLNPAVVRMQQIPPVMLPGPQDTLLIGRTQSNGIWAHPQVSQNHAMIHAQADGSHILRDLGSTNGTFVDGHRISTILLRPGNLVQIGPFRLVYNGAMLVQQVTVGALRIEARNLVVERPDEKASFSRQVAARLHGAAMPRKTILRQVSLCIEPREFVALVGGSGAGKSTLMGALSGFARATSGSLHVNGDDFYRNFDSYRAVLGYVPQDDIVHRTLPVSRALEYAARLRLPEDTTPAEIEARITRVLRDVEMSEHRATLVDHLSGGQRKRVSIGSELLADPGLFFLDEPTSGLDPGLEKKMMYTLRRLADSGRTVVLVTHATANIDQCDLVAFMAAGRLVYYGPPREARSFFGVSSNDFADIYTRIDGRVQPGDAVFAQDVVMQQLYRAWQLRNPGSTEQPWLAELWEERFRASPYYQRYVHDRLSQSSPVTPPPSPPRPARGTAQRSWLRQFWLLTCRYGELFLQDRRNLLILLLQAPIIAALLAFVVDHEAVSGHGATFSSARALLFMLATVAVWFGIINAAREITKESAIYRRERLSNLRIGPYVLSKVVILTGLVIVQSVLLLAIIGLRVQLPAEGLVGLISGDLFLTTFLASQAGIGLGLLISALAATPDRAISIVPLALIPQVIFSGVIFELKGGASVVSWLAIGRWAMDAYGTIIDLNALPLVAGGPRITPAYDEYTATVGHLVTRWGIMLLYNLACLLLMIWLLRRRDAH